MDNMSDTDTATNSSLFVVDAQDHDVADVMRRVSGIPQLQEIQSDYEVIFLGEVTSESEIISPVQYLVDLYRQADLADNERQTVLTQDDQLVALQLCMAQHNKEKYDDFDVDASDVLQLSRQLFHHKLRQSAITTTQSDSISDLYNKFCQQCNVVDIVDVFHKVKALLTDGESDLRKKCCYIAMQHPRNDLEVEVLRLLCTSDTYNQINFDPDLENGGDELVCQEISIDLLTPKPVDFNSSMSSTPSMSTSELLARQLFISYLTLLVNSRDEISLARCLSLTTDDLNHDGFTALKNEAKRKNMPMFQTAVSYVTQIRLGGKSYAPNPDSTLAAHVKGLSDFMTTVQKLQTLVEEIPDARTAVMKVIGSIRGSLCRCKTQTLKKTSVESICDQLKVEISGLMDVWKGSLVESPPRKIDGGQGRIVYGLKTIKLIQGMLDREAGRSLTTKPVQVLTDCFTSQKTPMRVPSLLSQFRSPEVIDPTSPEYQSLRDRLLSQKSATPARSKKSWQSDMAWAKPAIATVDADDDSADIFISPIQRRQSTSKRCGLWAVSPEGGSFRSRLVTPSTHDVRSTISHDVRSTITSNKLTLRTDLDYDYRPTEDTPKKRKKTCKKLPKESALDQENSQTERIDKQEQSKKRKVTKALGDDGSSQPSKKAKKFKVTKKKAVALVKGQRTLNSFFRV